MKISIKVVLAHCILFSIIFKINIGIGIYFIHFHWYLKKDITGVKFGTYTQTTV